MSASQTIDFQLGIDLKDLSDGGVLTGRVGSEDAILVRSGNEFFAVGALCTHYHALLADGLVIDGTIRCPMHHACFSLRTGEALRAPAIEPISRWRVEKSGERLFVRERLANFNEITEAKVAKPAVTPASVVIVGGGAAGFAAAEMLRREGYAGSLTMISADDCLPYDRPNLSKDFLAGNAPAEWMPLKDSQFYIDNRIEVMLSERVSAIDINQRLVRMNSGQERSFGALLLATGAEAVHLDISTSGQPRVFYLRTFSDCRAILAAAQSAKCVVIQGASFIGLETAASLRTRGIEVHIVARERLPFARVLGEEIGGSIRALHESHGVHFHFGKTILRIDGARVTLSDEESLDADLVVLGVGVSPAIALAAEAGLATDRGIVVNEYLETSASGIFAAGDVARYPDSRFGDHIRVEHWVVAERQGQIAAKNILGRQRAFDDVPFFWTQQYDLTINYVGHAETWDSIDMEGSPDSYRCVITYKRGAKVLAVATMARDLESLRAEHELAQDLLNR